MKEVRKIYEMGPGCAVKVGVKKDQGRDIGTQWALRDAGPVSTDGDRKKKEFKKNRLQKKRCRESPTRDITLQSRRAGREKNRN